MKKSRCCREGPRAETAKGGDTLSTCKSRVVWNDESMCYRFGSFWIFSGFSSVRNFRSIYPWYVVVRNLYQSVFVLPDSYRSVRKSGKKSPRLWKRPFWTFFYGPFSKIFIYFFIKTTKACRHSTARCSLARKKILPRAGTS